MITWSGTTTRAYALTGPILQRYRALGIGTSGIGWPISDVDATTGGQTRVTFERGMVFSGSSGVVLVAGRIYTRYRAMGAEKGTNGTPTANEAKSRVAGTGDVLQGFTGGVLVATGSGTFVVPNGPIRTLWGWLGTETSVLGTPRSDLGRYGATTQIRFAGGTIVTTARGI